jgi:hypothetical protein
MRDTLLAALAATIILVTGIVTEGSAASAPDQPFPIHSARAESGLVQMAAIVCGGNGCAPVQTKAPDRRKFHPLGGHA